MRLAILILFGLVISFLVRYYFFLSKDSGLVVGTELSVRGILWDEPKHSQYSQRFTINGIVASAPEYPQFHFGDNLLIKGVLEENTFIAKNGDQVREILIKNPEITILPQPVFLRWVTWMLNKISSSFTRVLPADEAALLLGVTIGVRSEFSKQLLDTFTATGILHVVAASGSNVATLAAVVLYSLEKVMKRRLALTGTIVIIGWYAVLAGFDPPIIRASLMALIALTAQIIGRQNYSLIALATTAWVMLMIDPELIANVGFQLSVSASGGIILIKPIIDKVLHIPKLLQEDFSTTLSAQFASLPILLNAFGSFAPLSIIVNILVLWTIPVIMIMGLLAALGSVIHPLLAVPFAYGAYPFLVYFLGVVRVLERFITPIQLESFSIFLTISYYMFLLSFILFMRPKQND